MKTKILRSKLIAIATLMLCIASQDSILSQNGVFYDNTIDVDGTIREYILYEPEGYVNDTLPLVFVFHGFNNTALFFSQYLNIPLIADTAQFFIVYPQGLVVEDLVFGGSGTGWNIPGNYFAAHDDILFVNEIIDNIISDSLFPIDTNRIHSAGSSSGAEMSFYTACALSDRIASVAGNVGQIALIMMDSLCTPDRSMSVLHCLGTNDPYFPVNGNQYFPHLEGVAEYWAEIDGCDSVPEIIPLPDLDPNDNSTVNLKIYGNCLFGYEVLCYRVEGGGHSWPGTGWNGSNMDIDIGKEMWLFFKRNPHPNYYLSINETVPASEFSIYPNPANDYLNIELLSNMSISFIEIINMQGILVKSQSIANKQNVIDVRDLSDGVYILRMHTDKGFAMRKMIKQ